MTNKLERHAAHLSKVLNAPLTEVEITRGPPTPTSPIRLAEMSPSLQMEPEVDEDLQLAVTRASIRWPEMMTHLGCLSETIRMAQDDDLVELLVTQVRDRLYDRAKFLNGLFVANGLSEEDADGLRKSKYKEAVGQQDKAVAVSKGIIIARTKKLPKIQ